MEFFTNAAQEKILEEKYQQLLSEAAKHHTSRKYTPKAFVSLPERKFICIQNKWFLESIECPLVPETGGDVYKLDPSFAESVREFYKRCNDDLTVIFYLSGTYGPTIEYCSLENVYPAKIISKNETLRVESMDKYNVTVL
jgi:hypothetical protein